MDAGVRATQEQLPSSRRIGNLAAKDQTGENKVQRWMTRIQRRTRPGEPKLGVVPDRQPCTWN